MKTSIVLACTAVAWLAAAPAASAQGDNYPSRPVTLLVPFPPGGSADVVIRPVAAKVADSAQAGDRHRQPLRRRRQHRGAGDEVGRARRLHAVPHQHGRDVGQSGPLAGTEPRSGQGLPADHADHHLSAHPGGAGRQPGEDGGRPRGACENQARRLELRLAGRRLRRADSRRDVQGPRRRADGARALSRRRTGRDRHRGGPPRLPVHLLHLDRRDGESRQASHRRHRRQEAHRRRAERPDHGGSGLSRASISKCGTAWWRRPERPRRS